MALWTSIRVLVDLDEALDQQKPNSPKRTHGIRKWWGLLKFKK